RAQELVGVARLVRRGGRGARRDGAAGRREEEKLSAHAKYEPTWDLPYASSRQPVMAGDVVATSQPLAAQAGLEMLRRGGNAVAAAIATAAALTVVEPTGNGIGSDAFALVWDGRRLHGLNASGRSPLGLDPERYLGLAEVPRVGWD